MITKKRECGICKSVLDLNKDNFHADKSRSCGFMYNCKSCEKVRTRAKYLKNPRLDRWSTYTKEQKIERQKVARKYFKTPKGRAIMMSAQYHNIDKIKGQESNLTSSFLLNYIFTKPCVYCGEDDPNKIGCDRIDNSIGHIQTNVLPCCGVCNVTRQDNFTVDEMKKIGAVIAQIKRDRSGRKEMICPAKI